MTVTELSLAITMAQTSTTLDSSTVANSITFSALIEPPVTLLAANTTITSAVTQITSTVGSSIVIETSTLTGGEFTTTDAAGAVEVITIVGNAPTATVTAAPNVATATVTAAPKELVTGGEIAGIVIGVLAALALILAFAGVLIFRRRRQKGKESDEDDPAELKKDDNPIAQPYARHEEDGEGLKELHGDALRREAGSTPLHEMQVEPSELEGDGPHIQQHSPVEIGLKSPMQSLRR